MGSEIPEWFEEKVCEELGLDFDQYFRINNEVKEGIKLAFELLSKPQNLKRIPEVKALVEALYMYAEELDWDRVNTFATINERGKRAKQALKPFEGV